jgi:hypothetical protein
VETVAGDRVLPLHFFENSLLVQGNNMAVSLVFDAVLDPETLRESPEALVKREGWQRLGGRLRRNVRINREDGLCYLRIERGRSLDTNVFLYCVIERPLPGR